MRSGGGQRSGDPNGVLPQSCALINEPISPPPAKKSGATVSTVGLELAMKRKVCLYTDDGHRIDSRSESGKVSDAAQLTGLHDGRGKRTLGR